MFHSALNARTMSGIRELSDLEISIVGGGKDKEPAKENTKSSDTFSWGDFSINCCGIGPFSIDVFTFHIPLLDAMRPTGGPTYTGNVTEVNGWTCRETTDGGVCTKD